MPETTADSDRTKQTRTNRGRHQQTEDTDHRVKMWRACSHMLLWHHVAASHLWPLFQDMIGNDSEQKPTRRLQMTKMSEVCSGGLQSRSRRVCTEILMNITSCSACLLGLIVKKATILFKLCRIFVCQVEFVINIIGKFAETVALGRIF